MKRGAEAPLRSSDTPIIAVSRFYSFHPIIFFDLVNCPLWQFDNLKPCAFTVCGIAKSPYNSDKVWVCA